MSYIPIEQVKEGQVIIENVHDINGRLLLSKGRAIESKHIRVFKIWGVAEVKVQCDTIEPTAETTEIDAAKLERIGRSAGALFINIDLDRPLASAVFQSIVQYRYAQDLIPGPEKAEGRVDGADIKPSDLETIDINRKIQRGRIKLPEVPSIVLRLNEVMDNPNASASDVAQVVGSSPSLSAILLRIVNSAAFGLPVRVDSIVRAVSMLGTREISNLAIGISVMQVFKDIPGGIIDMRAFLIHSLACATVTRILSALANINTTEQLFIAGLLHDIGRLVLYRYFPKHSVSILNQLRSEDNRESLYAIEKRTLKTTHCQIARHLLRKWRFPDALQNNIVHHHQPSRADHPGQAAIVQLADIIAHGTCFGGSGERILPGFDQSAWSQVGLSVNSVTMAIRQAAHQLKTINSILG